ncbi:MAG: DNA methyltransferase [candidate division Zixibacteria bacterium HGW-Zixibacteria-1]|nr:MAG: DNA methyltransferase [candidate division Zixibacteria bacterium HGW-Zixibacteria-1]
MLILKALQRFAGDVTAKLSQVTAGDPEDQLRGPFENLMSDAALELAHNLVCTGEARLAGRLGRPDFAVHLNKLLVGYVELKAPGTGVNTRRFTGHNREQWKRFQSLPNLLYCDGNEWALYRSGVLIDKVVKLSGDVTSKGKNAVKADDADDIAKIIRKFLAWEPSIPTGRNNKIDLLGFAKLLAPLCRLLRDNVTDALNDTESPLVELAKDWRKLLFPDASDEQFADAYAQTVAFALLLGRSEGADPLTLSSAVETLAAQHSLLSRALQVLTDPRVHTEISSSLDLLIRVIAVVPPATLSGPEDPWLYFYEDFLATYDAKLRKDAGAYYTPVEVVRAQVRLIDDLLVNRLGKRLGFADSEVVTLDPATGTGTYLLGVIEHALNRIRLEQGAGAVPGRASSMAANLYGFEIMVGPFAVTELRVSRALRDQGAELPKDGTHIYLTDTLESPDVVPPQLSLYLKPISDQHARALEVKSKVPVIVCLGNPPYDRHEAAVSGNKAQTGGWVRWGDDGEGKGALFRDFLDPALEAGHGVHVKNLYNLYIYFWRWALWKVFEHEIAHGPGIVSFITASSYLEGNAFSGMREHMRRVCDEIWIIDLGGEGRGTRKSENVFAIQTPVAIAVAMRSGKLKNKQPAKVHYARIEGGRKEKLQSLNDLHILASLKWQECSKGWQTPFKPEGKGEYFSWPLLTNILPWQHSGIECKRTWPIGPDKETLKKRWRKLLNAENRATLFRETPDRLVSGKYKIALTSNSSSTPIAQLPKNAPYPPIYMCAFRSFDRQHIIADARLMSRPRPDLWRCHGQKQVYMTSLLNHPLGRGPALTSCSEIPDRHHLRGSYGGKDILPLYRDAKSAEANILQGLLEMLEKEYKTKILPEEFIAYIYGTLAQPAFTERFSKELITRELHVPITKNKILFKKIRDIGAYLLWLHTYGERFIPKTERKGSIPPGAARCIKAVPGNPDEYPEGFVFDETKKKLYVGCGEFSPVQREVFEFEVSGLKVVQSWLKYRMKKGAGRKSSPLDDIRPERWTSQFTTQLLELLWVLEATIAIYPKQAKLLEDVIAGACFKAAELPKVPERMRKPPASRKADHDLFDNMK